MQGRLGKEPLSVTIETACGHCGRLMSMTVSSDVKVSIHDEDASPLVFMPQVDWQTFAEPNIIHAY